METEIILVYGMEPKNFNRLTEWKPEILSGKMEILFSLQNETQKFDKKTEKLFWRHFSNLEPQTNNQISR